MQTLPAPREVVLEQLERMLASETFAGAERSRALLKFLVEQTLENQSDRLKEYTIGSEALGRGDSFDPRTDPIVRAEASRLRSRIERYYAINGVADTVLITLPKGSYVPQVQTRAVPEAAPVAATAGGSVSKPGSRQRFIWFVLGGITVGAAVMLLAWKATPEAPAPEFGRVVELGGEGYSPGSDIGNDAILSPDGTRIVFVALGSDHVPRLMQIRLGPDQRPVLLPETDGARAPFFSSNSQWVGFWAPPKLKIVSVNGGSPQELTDAENFGGASWGENDDIIASIDHTLMRVSFISRKSEPVVDLREFGLVPCWPEILPGGQHVLFVAVGPHGPDASNIEVLSLSDGNKRTPLKIRAGFARYLRDGYLLYGNQGTLYAVPFNPQQPLTVEGMGVPVLQERVAYSAIFGNAKFDIARNGTLIYRRSPPLVAAWLDRNGTIEQLPTKPAAYTFPRVSLDGQRLAVNVIDGGVPYIEIHDLRRQQVKRLPFTAGMMSPVWHRDGFLVLGSRAGMSWMKADDMSKLQTLTQTPNVQIPWSFTANGKRLAYIEPAPSLDLWTIPVSPTEGKLGTTGEPESFLQTPLVDSAPSFSPDDHWLAYGSGRNDQMNVYVRRFPRDSSNEVRVSQDGGRIARWLQNRREIVYRTDDHRLMVVGYQVKNGTFIPDKPTPWTKERLGDTGVIPNFDIYNDRVLGLVPASREEAERARTQVTVIPRFADEVRRRLARGGK